MAQPYVPSWVKPTTPTTPAPSRGYTPSWIRRGGIPIPTKKISRFEQVAETYIGEPIRGAAEALTGIKGIKGLHPEIYSPRLRQIGAIGGQIAGFLPLLRGASIAARALPAAVRLPAAVAAAAGTQEAARQGIRRVATGEAVQPKEIAAQAAVAGALPIAGPVVGKALSLPLQAIGPVARARVGRTLAAPLRFVAQRSGPTIRDAWDRLDRAITPAFQTAQRHQILRGTARTKTIIDRTLGVAETTGGFRAAPTARTAGSLLRTWSRDLMRNPNPPYYVRERAQILRRISDQIDRMTVDPAVPRAAYQAAIAAGQSAKVARAAAQAALIGAPRRGLSDQNISKIVNEIDKGITAHAYGKNPSPAEASLLVWLKESFLFEKRPIWERASRSFLSHFFIGLGNVGSAAINLTAVATNVVPVAGGTATSRALNEVLSGSAQAKRMAAFLFGKAGRGRQLGQIIPGPEPSALSRASYWMFSTGERNIRTVGGLASYYNDLARGVAPAVAMRQAKTAVRRMFFNYQYDMAGLLRKPGAAGAAVRTAFQFYPFVLGQANFMAGLTLPQFVNQIVQYAALGGIPAIPGARIVDRILPVFTGVSIIDALEANEETRPLVHGLWGTVMNVATGRRLDATEDITSRWMNMDDAPFYRVMKNVAKGLDSYLREPTIANAQRLLTAMAPTSVANLARAAQEERAGSYLTGAGETLAPTIPRGLALRSLGLEPGELAGARAKFRIGMELDRRAVADLENARYQIRVAAAAKDIGAIIRWAQYMADKGATGPAIRSTIERAMLPPDVRLLRDTMTRNRPKLLQYLDFDDGETPYKPSWEK